MPVPGCSVVGVCRSDGNYRRIAAASITKARDRGPHELRREALPECGRGWGGATGAPDETNIAGKYPQTTAHSHYDEPAYVTPARGERAPVSRLEFAPTSFRKVVLKELVSRNPRSKAMSVTDNAGLASSVFARSARADARDIDAAILRRSAGRSDKKCGD